MKKVAIIIVTYNSKNLIYDCLNSIFENNDIDDRLEVIVADNASADQSETFDLINKEFGGKNVRCFDTGENAGYGKGNNFGISHTDADILIVMNPDVRFVHPVFNIIINEFSNPNLGMAGVEFIDGSNPYFFKPEAYTLYRCLFIHRYIKKRRYDVNKMYMSGSLLIFDREAFIEAGRFDENIFMYFEEADITNRMLSIGKDIKWLKGIFVQHLAHGRKFNQRLIDVGYDALEYYCDKYGINAKRIYIINKWIFRIKIILATIVRDNGRLDIFEKTLASLNKHLKLL